jgi:hypothetical protein
VDVSGAHGEVLYSINGGTFTQDSFFIMLEPGNYLVTVRDSAGCEVKDSVTVSTMTSTTSPTSKNFVSLSPNPGDGVYQITASFDLKDIFIPFTVVTSSGEPVVYGSVARYNNVYRNELSLHGNPPGVYYIVFDLGREMIVRKIVKAN